MRSYKNIILMTVVTMFIIFLILTIIEKQKAVINLSEAIGIQIELRGEILKKGYQDGFKDARRLEPKPISLPDSTIRGVWYVMWDSLRIEDYPKEDTIINDTMMLIHSFNVDVQVEYSFDTTCIRLEPCK